MAQHLTELFHDLPIDAFKRGAEFIEPNRAKPRYKRAKLVRDIGKLSFMNGDQQPDALHCKDCARGALGWRQERHDWQIAVDHLRQSPR